MQYSSQEILKWEVKMTSKALRTLGSSCLIEFEKEFNKMGDLSFQDEDYISSNEQSSNFNIAVDRIQAQQEGVDYYTPFIEAKNRFKDIFKKKTENSEAEQKERKKGVQVKEFVVEQAERFKLNKFDIPLFSKLADLRFYLPLDEPSDVLLLHALIRRTLVLNFKKVDFAGVMGLTKLMYKDTIAMNRSRMRFEEMIKSAALPTEYHLSWFEASSFFIKNTPISWITELFFNNQNSEDSENV